MKILHVITNYAGAGGAERALSRVVAGNPQHEHVIVALMGFSTLYQDTLQRCPGSVALGWNLINTVPVLWRLKCLITEIQPDAIQGWMYHANVFASMVRPWLRHQPPLYWGIRHSLDSPDEESRSTKVALRLSKWLSREPDVVVYCAQSGLEKHAQFGFKPRQSLVIPNGVVLPAHQTARSFHHSPLRVGFAGRYHHAKGFPYLFAAIAQIQSQRADIEFCIAGTGVSLDNPEIMALIHEHAIDMSRVELCGHVSDMAAFYQRIDLLLLTSITEGFPNVLVEAMATGVPCVATDVGDARMIIGDSGMVVPRRDVAAIADAVLRFAAADEAERQARSQQAIAVVQSQFQLHVVAARYAELWQQGKALT